MKTDVAVVVPVYNEVAAIEDVVRSWTELLNQLDIAYAIGVVDDGSTDGTAALLDSLADTMSVTVIHQKNGGHSAACETGYHWALEQEAEWILQIDGDGQCDPSFFPDFWQQRSGYDAVYGYRRQRDDGWLRQLISWSLTGYLYLRFRIFVPDAHVPYRLMQADILRRSLQQLNLPAPTLNIFIALYQTKHCRLCWLNIGFRRRVKKQRAWILPRIWRDFWCCHHYRPQL